MAGVSAAAGSEPPVHDLPGQVQDCGVAVQDEVGVGGQYMVCPVCFNAKQLDQGGLLANAKLAGSVQLWEWIGDDGATTFSY